jgi:predicted nucleic acid-binding protein
MLIEVLQGFSDERDFQAARDMLTALEFVVLGGEDVAEAAANNYRRLRSLGVTARKTIDTIIATRCIVSGYELLHDDRDFQPFEKYLGLECL